MTQAQTGLTTAEAAEILRRDGPNEIARDRQRGAFRIVLDAVKEPMLQLLLAAGVIYLIIGDLAEALILLAFAVLNVGLVVVQESRTERALAALNDLTSPRAMVVRDGTRVRIPGTEVVVLHDLTSPVPSDGHERAVAVQFRLDRRVLAQQAGHRTTPRASASIGCQVQRVSGSGASGSARLTRRTRSSPNVSASRASCHSSRAPRAAWGVNSGSC